LGVAWMVVLLVVLFEEEQRNGCHGSCHGCSLRSR
jgi:hypothetical protein